MPQNETPPETDMEASAPTANPQAEVADREAAALEEQLQVQQLAQKRSESEQVGEELEKVTLIGAAAKGRDHLLAQMRKHAETEAANKKTYVPPPQTERQSENTRLEMEAGRRAQQKHAAQQANRPVPARDPREAGPANPVHRPNDVVPDPKGGPMKPFSPDV